MDEAAYFFRRGEALGRILLNDLHSSLMLQLNLLRSYRGLTRDCERRGDAAGVATYKLKIEVCGLGRPDELSNLKRLYEERGE